VVSPLDLKREQLPGGMADRVRAHPWGDTSLGPLRTWSPRLRGILDVVLESPSPAVLLCGPGGLVIYNDGFAALAVPLHPLELGASALRTGNDFGATLAGRVLAGHTVRHQDRAFMTAGRGVVHLHLAYTPVRDEAGQTIAAFGLISDETDRLRELASVSRDEFLAVLVHELRAPLSAVMMWSSMLRAGSIRDDERSQAVAAIEEGALTQNRLIDDLIDLSRLAAGTLVLEIAPVDPAVLLARVVDSVRPMAAAKEVSLRGAALERGSQFCIDADRMERVIWNLLHNAIKFTPKGGRVALVAVRRRGGLCIEVSDTGRGIDAENLRHIFDGATHVEAGRQKSLNHLGLGLGITRQLVELHGGSLVAQSEGRGRGAKFTIELPDLQPS
jgi:signal transduction histidine kinase